MSEEQDEWSHHPTNKQVIVDSKGEIIAVVRAPGNRNDIGDANAERIVAACKSVADVVSATIERDAAQEHVGRLKAENYVVATECIHLKKTMPFRELVAENSELASERDKLTAEISRQRTAIERAIKVLPGAGYLRDALATKEAE